MWWWKLARLLGDDGSSLVEYALVLSLTALVSIAALEFIGVHVNLDLREVARALR